MIYLDINPNTVQSMKLDVASSGSATSIVTGNLVQRAVSSSTNREVNEDDVDHFLWKLDGKIERERNEQLLVLFFTMKLI